MPIFSYIKIHTTKGETKMEYNGKYEVLFILALLIVIFSSFFYVAYNLIKNDEKYMTSLRNFLSNQKTVRLQLKYSNMFELPYIPDNIRRLYKIPNIVQLIGRYNSTDDVILITAITRNNDTYQDIMKISAKQLEVFFNII